MHASACVVGSCVYNYSGKKNGRPTRERASWRNSESGRETGRSRESCGPKGRPRRRGAYARVCSPFDQREAIIPKRTPEWRSIQADFNNAAIRVNPNHLIDTNQKAFIYTDVLLFSAPLPTLKRKKKVLKFNQYLINSSSALGSVICTSSCN